VRSVDGDPIANTIAAGPDMNTLVKSIEGEYLRYRALAESALAQVPDAALCAPGLAGGNSLAVICWHVGGNLASRFTDFLTSDGEKPWRDRDAEFAARTVTRDELMAQWNRGWTVLLETIAHLSDGDLSRTVTIRGQPLLVHEALHRSLAHASYHVGQIVYLAHIVCGEEWKYLSIAPGASAQYNANPQYEKAGLHAARLGAEAPRER
jgi:hypothetical protein